MTRSPLLVNNIFSLTCPGCEHKSTFRVMGPMSCVNCLTKFPEAINVMLDIEERYNYFVSDEGMEWY